MEEFEIEIAPTIKFTQKGIIIYDETGMEQFRCWEEAIAVLETYGTKADELPNENPFYINKCGNQQMEFQFQANRKKQAS